MARFEITAPDGRRFEVTAPDGASQEDVLAYARTQFQTQGAKPGPDLKRELAKGTSATDAAIIGSGKMGSELWEGLQKGGMGIAAIMSQLLPERLKQAAQEELTKRLLAQEKRIRQEGGAQEYKHLEAEHPIATTVGEVAPLVASPMLRVAQGPGAGTAAVNAAASAAVPAAIQYGTPEEAAKRTALAASGGAAGSALTSGAVKVLGGIKNVLTPEAQRLAVLAEEKFGIPLDAAQKTGSKALQTMEAAMDSMPVTAGAQAAKKTGQRSAFTREVMKTMGETADEASPSVLQAGAKRIGGDFERIFGKVHVNLDDEAVQTSMGKVVQESVDTLTPDQARIVVKRVGELLDKIDDNGAVAGKAYQAWRSSVQKQAMGTNDKWLGTQLRNLYRTVDQAAYKAAAEVGEDTALGTARGQYKNMKIIEELAGKTEDGILSPKLLREAVKKRVPDYAEGGGGDIAELARIGRKFIADQVPTSGTSERQLAQTLLTGGAVGGGTFMLTEDPGKAMAYGAGAMALPKAVQAALNSGAGQTYLSKGLRQLTPIEQALLDRMARLGTLGLVQPPAE